VTQSDTFTMRISPVDRRRLTVLAEQVARSESDVIRLLIRNAQPAAIGGISLSAVPVQERDHAPEVVQSAA